MEQIDDKVGFSGSFTGVKSAANEYYELDRGYKGSAILYSNKDYIEPEYGFKGVSITFKPVLTPLKIVKHNLLFI